MSRARRRPIPHPANWARRRTRKDHWCGWIWIRSSSMPPTISGFTRRWAIRSRSVWRASATRYALGSASRCVCPTGRANLRNSTSIARGSRMRRSSCLFTAVRGAAGRGGKNQIPPQWFSNPAPNSFRSLFFTSIKQGGDLRLMAAQVRSAIAWAYKNAASFGADTNRLYIGGRSSGAHLTAVALVTDWERDYGVPTDIVKGGICSSGMYDLNAVRLSKRNSFVRFTDEMEQAMSPQRQLDKLRAPVVVTYGTN